MGLFDGFSQYLSDPENAARIRGALIGAGQAVSQPYGNLGSIAMGAGAGSQTGLNNYFQQQKNQLALQSGQYSLLNDKLGLAQKLGSINYFRQASGQPAISQDDFMKGNFGFGPSSAGTAAATPAPAPQAAPMGTPSPAATNSNPFSMANVYSNFIAPHEGGYTPSDGNGAPANFGINQKANPDVNVANLTQQSAQQLLNDRYFGPSGASSMQGPIAAIQADTAMNMGNGAASQLLQQSGGDPQKYLDLREQRYRNIAANDPSKVPNLPGWLKRNNDLRAYVAQTAPQAAPVAPTAQVSATSQAPGGITVSPALAQIGAFNPELAQKLLLEQKNVMTPDQVKAAGLRDGTVATRDVNGNIAVLQASDLKSPGAEQQQERISEAEARAKRDAVVAAVDPSYIANQAHAIATYRQPAGTMSLRYPELSSAIMAKVYTENPNYDAKQYGAANKAVSAFDTGKQGDQVRSFNTSIAHLNTLQDLAGALQNGDVKALNSISNTFKDQFGKAAPTNFDAAKNIVGDEIIKAIIGGGGALADRENAQNQVSRANSPAQLAGVIQTYKSLMAGQLVSLKKQYEGSTHLNDFNDKLLPETQKELGNIAANPAPQIPKIAPSQGAVQMLKMNPKLRDQFDAKYGAGSSASILGK